MNTTTIYLEPPLRTFHFLDIRGLVRICSVRGVDFLTLTLEERDKYGRWAHVKTQRTTYDLSAVEFEKLAHDYVYHDALAPEPLPDFELADGAAEPVPARLAGPLPTQLRDAITVLFAHHFDDELGHYEELPPDHRDYHIFPYWVAVFNHLHGEHFLPEDFLDAESSHTTAPTWTAALLAVAIFLPPVLALLTP